MIERHARFRWSLALTLTILACTPAPSSPDPIGTAESVHDAASLITQLQRQGLRVERQEEIEQPFFTPKANVIRIGDRGEAQVYEYAKAEEAAREAGRVNANGSIGSSMPMWIAPPHFFRKGSLLVLYLGSDERTLTALRELLGAPFAGQ